MFFFFPHVIPMNFYADYIRNKLSSVIKKMEHQSEKFVKNPGHDFTRNRKMNFISTINFLRTMEGGSIGAELHKYFNYDLNHITRSGFIRQRNKLHPNAMEHLFREFHQKFHVAKPIRITSYLPVMDQIQIYSVIQKTVVHILPGKKVLLDLTNCILTHYTIF